jgi:hypothetical protein
VMGKISVKKEKKRKIMLQSLSVCNDSDVF